MSSAKCRWSRIRRIRGKVKVRTQAITDLLFTGNDKLRVVEGIKTKRRNSKVTSELIHKCHSCVRVRATLVSLKSNTREISIGRMLIVGTQSNSKNHFIANMYLCQTCWRHFSLAYSPMTAAISFWTVGVHNRFLNYVLKIYQNCYLCLLILSTLRGLYVTHLLTVW